MTEAGWLTSADPVTMLRWISLPFGDRPIAHPQIPISDRKLRLLACACHEVARRDANGALHDDEALQAAYAVADGASPSLLLRHSHWVFALASAERAARRAVEVNYKGAAPSLLRCLFGNPFRPHVVLPRDVGVVLHNGPKNYRQDDVLLEDVLHWHDGTVVKMARSIYDGCDFSAMPVLGDALEEAGCENEGILRHCREPGLHGRGCHAVDLLLGKS